MHGDLEGQALHDRRFLGSLIARLPEDASRIRAWEQGASGERIVGARLDKIEGIALLHDRRIPGTRTDIDHIAIASGGVYVIDAKFYGGTVAYRVDGLLRQDRGLWIGARDRTKLVGKVVNQMNAITRVLCATPILVTGAVCFVNDEGPAPALPLVLNGVWVGGPDALPDLVGRPGFLDAEAMQTVAEMLDARLPRS